MKLSMVPLLCFVMLSSPGWLFGQELESHREPVDSSELECSLALLSSDRSEDRAQACQDLKKWGDEAAIAIPQLLDILEQDLAESVQARALEALGKISCKASALVPVLIDIIATRNGEVQVAAVVALKDLSKESRAVLPKLLKLLRHPRSLVRIYAVSALKALGPEEARALPVLKAAIFDPHPMVRRLAARSISSIGEPAIKTLLDLSHDKDQGITELAVSGLEQIAALEDISEAALIEAFSNLNASSKLLHNHVATRFLPKLFDSATEKTLEDIGKAIAQKDNRVDAQRRFLRALQTHGQRFRNKKVLIPTLKRFLVHKNQSLNMTALGLIRVLKEDAAVLLPAIAKVAENPQLTIFVVRNTSIIGPQVIPFYLKLLERKNSAVTNIVYRELSRMKGRARSALPALKKRQKIETNAFAKRYLKRAITAIENDKNFRSKTAGKK
jgi:HEAT repeat protein